MANLTIKGFKCFRDLQIPINDLTVLAGSNGHGKSTVVQSFLLLRQTAERFGIIGNPDWKANSEVNWPVLLNGPYCLALGGAGEMLHAGQRGESEISFSLETGENTFEVKFDSTADDALSLTPEKISYDELDHPILKDEFHYLNAERNGPRISQTVQYSDFPNTGHRGEFVAQLLGDTDYHYRNEVDEDRRRKETTINPRLPHQVNAWLDFIMPGIKVDAFFDSKTLSAQVLIDNPFMKGGQVLSTNIGFGISYVLPIIVSGLITKTGSFLIVENPEAHLHPSAQSRIGQFLSFIASQGVKVIIETHSDHVLNGVQLAVAKKQLSPGLISVNYFSNAGADSQPQLETISINEMGELSDWPKGFFDQTQRDFAELFKLRKG